jgi:hypothetical protein
MLISLLIIPLIGIFLILFTKDNIISVTYVINDKKEIYGTSINYNNESSLDNNDESGIIDNKVNKLFYQFFKNLINKQKSFYPINIFYIDNYVSTVKLIALFTSILNLFVSLIIFILFDFSTNQLQFVQDYHDITFFNLYLGIDGLSIYFILLTTIIIPISLLSN